MSYYLPFTPAHPGACAECQTQAVCQKDGARCVMPEFDMPGDTWINPLLVRRTDDERPATNARKLW